VFSGIRTVDNSKILAGAIPACILALLVDRVFAAIETIVTPISLMEGKDKSKKIKQKKLDRLIVIAAMATMIGLIMASYLKPKEENQITIASQDFTENEILAYMMEEMIENETGYNVEVIPDLGGESVCLSSIRAGEIDGYVDYTGTLYVNVLKKEAISDVTQVYEETRSSMLEQYNLVVLPSLNVNNTYTISTTKEIAEEYGLKTISDLKKYNGKLKMVSTLAFLNREDGLQKVKDAYGLIFNDEIGVDGASRYTALMNGEGDLIDAYSTDGLLEKFELKILEDDKGAFPPYYAVPVFRSEIIEKYPAISSVTEKMTELLSTEEMAKLNYLVDEEGMSPKDVAYDFLDKNSK